MQPVTQINTNDMSSLMHSQSQCQTAVSRSRSKFVNIAMNGGKLFVKTTSSMAFSFIRH